MKDWWGRLSKVIRLNIVIIIVINKVRERIMDTFRIVWSAIIGCINVIVLIVRDVLMCCMIVIVRSRSSSSCINHSYNSHNRFQIQALEKSKPLSSNTLNPLLQPRSVYKPPTNHPKNHFSLPAKTYSLITKLVLITGTKPKHSNTSINNFLLLPLTIVNPSPLLIILNYLTSIVYFSMDKILI